MPPRTYAIMLTVAIVAGGLTVGLVMLGGITALAIAIPVLMIATVALKFLRK